jgi:hypothetical protein
VVLSLGCGQALVDGFRATVRAWTFGQPYRRGPEQRRFAPVIRPADRDTRRLSFLNSIELLVLAAIRGKRTVARPQMRRALRFLEKQCPSRHPLADPEFQTHGAFCSSRSSARP